LCAETVVQVAPETAPLLLPGCNQTFAGALQFGGQPHGMHSHFSLSCEIFKQAPVGI
jgi:hypothetical protein